MTTYTAYPISGDFYRSADQAHRDHLQHLDFGAQEPSLYPGARKILQIR